MHARPVLAGHALLPCLAFSFLMACSSSPSEPEEMHVEGDLGRVDDLVEMDMRTRPEDATMSDLDLSEARDEGGDAWMDAGARDMQATQDMADMGEEEEDLGSVSYHTIARFPKLRREVSAFPELVMVEPDMGQDPSTLHLEGRLRLDPSYTNTNGYPTVELEMPDGLGGCLGDATLTAFEIDPPETVNLPDMYVMSSFVDDRLRVIVRGSGEITLLVTGRLQVDAASLPAGCIAPEIDASLPIAFEIALKINTTPVQYSTSIQDKRCPILGEEGEQRGYAMRAGTPLPGRLNISHYSLDAAWPYPANADPTQQFELAVKGPDTIPTEEMALLSQWLVPDTRHPLELTNLFSFDVVSADDPIATLEPIMYLPGYAGTPLRLTSGMSYSEFGRKTNRLLVYIAEMETMRGKQLCTEHMLQMNRPQVRVEVSSRTPQVCRVQPVSPLTRESVHPFFDVDRWYLGKDEVVLEQDGWCRLDYEFYVDDMVILSLPFEVEMSNVANLIDQ